MKRIYITSIGIISSIGNNVEETDKSLLEGKRGQGTTEFVDSDLAKAFPLCEVNLSNDELAKRAGVFKGQIPHKMFPCLRLLLQKRLLIGAKIRKGDGISTGLIVWDNCRGNG